MKKLLTLLVLCATLLIGCETDNYVTTLEDVKVVGKNYSTARARYSTITVEGSDVKLELKIQDSQFKAIQEGSTITVKFDNRDMLINHIKFKGEKKSENN
ncbi:hypothetical protein [Bacillus phage Hakuna]|uniref:DUF3221 domain-containing protein n=2 Tax=Wphvirus TaxID=1922327 RepID=A0A024B1M5_9CAUD|nr:hypothetical protein FP72_gp249 [Bacillus phage Hakuna]YP_009281055.1 hypothetical protein SAGEFAYGE_252 [Bacillus phage SageFayge]AHZ10267.1 hypothetical protein [Bacillus phage Hakuna]AMW63172.1 hypothetical protein SAGEFAYGE_252 [Bacillus phage SageFayge]QDH49527.1 hypothetical protein PHIREBALL_253 [Bacillus phage Phireball]